jgi:serine/threonine-protein kinase
MEKAFERLPAKGQINHNELLQQFDRAWQEGRPPHIPEFLALGSALPSPARRQLVEGIVQIDLEYRWRHAAQGKVNQAGSLPQRPLLNDYLKCYPELGPVTALSVELIGEEYWVRRVWGDRPAHQEYVARFPHLGAKLQENLKQIDAEIAAEYGPKVRSGAAARRAVVQTVPRPLESAGQLVETLQRCGLLNRAQLDEINRDLQRRFPEPRALSSELLRRNWLTPFQVNQLLQGRGADLVLGAYLLLERLGEGGAGQVFKARHRKMDRIVALKLIRKELLTDAEVVGRFYREIQILSQLDHPNVVHAYDAGPAGATHFLAMEFVEGTDLGKLVKQGGSLPVQQACEYIRQAAAGLQHAHERGLVHRDIKPHNLIMSLHNGLIKVADLGLARLPRAANSEWTSALTGVKGTGTLTPENAVMMGTVDYLAPEQALDFHKADIRADIYSLGCTFYYLLTGQPPFAGATLAEKLVRHQQAEPPSLDNFRKDLPAGLFSLVRKMLAKRPEDRFQTPGEIADDLAQYSNSGQPTARKRRLIPAVSWKWSRRRVLIGLAGGLGAVALTSAGYWLLSSTPIDSLRRKLQDPRTDLTEAWSLHDNYCAHYPDPQKADDLMRQYLLDLRARDPRSHTQTAGLELMKLPSPLDRLSAFKNQYFSDLVAEFGQPAEPRIIQLAISADCKRLALARASGAIDLWEASTGTKSFSLAGNKPIVAMAFSPHDGNLLATIADDSTVTVWDLALKKTRALQPPKAPSFAFSPDGTKLTLAGQALMLWNVNTGKSEVLIDQFNAAGKQVVFSPDGRTLAWITGTGPPTLWDVHGKKERVIAGLPPAEWLAFAPNSQTMAIGYGNVPIKIWDLGKEKQSGVPLGKPSALPVSFSADGRKLITYTGLEGTSLLDVESGKELWRGGGHGLVLYLATDGKHLTGCNVGQSSGYIFRIPNKALGR